MKDGPWNLPGPLDRQHPQALGVVVEAGEAVSFLQALVGLQDMVPRIRFERTTFPLGGGRSILLSYRGEGEDGPCDDSTRVVDWDCPSL